MDGGGKDILTYGGFIVIDPVVMYVWCKAFKRP